MAIDVLYNSPSKYKAFTAKCEHGTHIYAHPHTCT